MPEATPLATWKQLLAGRDCNAVQCGKFLLTSLALAWVMAALPQSVFLNLLLVLAAAAAARVWLRTAPIEARLRHGFHHRRATFAPVTFQEDASAQTSTGAGPHRTHHHRHGKKPTQWRRNVGSKVVEHAWETLCGSIVQEFIYDTWYASLTPDKEFPAEVRRVLNYAFGQLALRAQRIDLRDVLHDVSELLMEQVELYRDTREMVLSDKASGAAADFNSGVLARRERALRERMAADGNLHPALLQPSGDYKMLRAVSDGLVGQLLDPTDSSRTMSRAVSRELLAACVLRPLMMFSTPYYVNKGMYKLLEERAQRERSIVAVPAAEAAKQRQLRGTYEFERRIVQTVEEEGGQMHNTASPARQAMPPPPPRALRHSRSRSYDDVVAAMGPQGADAVQPARFWSETGVPRASVQRPCDTAQLARPSVATTSSLTVLEPQRSIDSSVSSGVSSSSATSPARPLPVARSNTSSPVPPKGGGGPDSGGSMRGRPPASEASVLSSTATTLNPSPFDQEGSFSSPMRPHYTSAQVKWHHSPSGEVENGHGGHLLAPQVLPSVIGFMGDPRARVVAADLNTSGAKDFVVYKIRVGDDSGCEWTVSRRYRHFEVLHRQLRSSPGYAFKLPPKRIFIHTQNADFVEDRRQALDAFLQELLRVPELASSKDLWEFLRAGSERFEAPRQGSRDVGKKGNLRRGLSKTVLHGAQSIGRGVVGATVDVTQAVTHGVKTGVSESVSAAVGGVGAVLQEAKSSLGIGHRRSASVPEELEAFDPGEATAAPKARKHSADPLMRAGTGLLRTATASARKVKNAFVPHGPTQSHGSEAPANPKALFSGVFAGEEQAGRVGSATSSEALSPDKRPRGGARTKSRSRNGSPTKMRRAVTEDVALPTRTVAFTPATGLPHAASWAQSHGYAYAALDMSGLSDPHAAADATIEVDAFGQGSPMSPASPPVVEYAAGADAGGLDWDACAGISAPLYEIVDSVFQLQTRGFFRRQVYVMARQVLSMAIGDAIDVYLLSRLRLLRQESTIASLIQNLQSSLWPGGTWFQNTPQYMALHPEAGLARTSSLGSPTAAVHARAATAVSPERFLEPCGPPPLDEDEIREAVGELLLRRAPTALVRLVGKGPYTEGVSDLYEMMQSPTFMRQLGYGVLEIGALHLCPELKEMFHNLEHGGLEKT